CSCAPSPSRPRSDVRAAAAPSCHASCPASLPSSPKMTGWKPPPIPPTTVTSTRTIPGASPRTSSVWARRWARIWDRTSTPPWTRAGPMTRVRGARPACQKPGAAMKVETLPGFEGLDEAHWNGLLGQARLPSVFLTWQWQTSWAAAFLGGRALHLLRITDDAGMPTGLLPLYDETPGERRLVGGVDVSDYLDLIAPAGREEEVWQALLQHRAGDAAAWDLHGIRALSPTLEILPRLSPASGRRASVEREDRCPVLELPSSVETSLERLSRKARHES